MSTLLLTICFFVSVHSIEVQANEFQPLDRHFDASFNPYFNEKVWTKRNKPTIDFKPKGKNPQPANSGITIINFDDQIIGGKKATRGQFPWQALLTLDGSYMCGGSLISTDWVLTAAHCCHTITDFQITLGIVNKTGEESSKVVYRTQEKYVHQNYDDVYLTNDIALLKLPQSVEINRPFITPIRLPRTSEARKNMIGKNGIISGWGKVGDDDGPSESLKFVHKKIVENKACAKLYGNITITGSSLCISNSDLKGTCNGDSGGPFVIKDQENKFTQIGIVSFGSSISCVKFPSGFTRVSSFLGWISETTGLQIRP